MRRARPPSGPQSTAVGWMTVPVPRMTSSASMVAAAMAAPYHQCVTANARDGIARDPTVLDGSKPGASGAGGGGGDGDELAAGSAAGDYVVDRRLGGGAMGDVYAGHHPVIGKKVAIKVIKRELASRADSA